MTALLCALLAGTAAWWALPAPRRAPTVFPVTTGAPDRVSGGDAVRALASGCVAAALLWVVGPALVPAAPAALWTFSALLVVAVSPPVLLRSARSRASGEAPLGRRARARLDAAVAADLTSLVLLIEGALREGVAPIAALDIACRALPGPAAARVRHLVAHRDAEQALCALSADAALAPLGRALLRAHRSGAAVAAPLDRLRSDLARGRRAAREARARAVGVRAAVPLGVCLLPGFVLLGVVPSAAGLLRGVLA